MPTRKTLSKQDLKTLRHNISVLKTKGLVSKRIDARSYQPSRYMIGKVKSLEGILTGELRSVKLNPKALKMIRQEAQAVAYYGKPPIIGKHLIVRNSPEIIKRARLGYWEEVTPIKEGIYKTVTRLKDVKARDLFNRPDKYAHLVGYGELIKVRYGEAVYTYKDYGHFIENALRYRPYDKQERSQYDSEITFEAIKMDPAYRRVKRDKRASRYTGTGKRGAPKKYTPEELRERHNKQRRDKWAALSPYDRKVIAEASNRKRDIKSMREREEYYRAHPNVKKPH